jgi:ABC-type nitrate/sulfonate/bicarbonate transport system permease component
MSTVHDDVMEPPSGAAVRSLGSEQAPPPTRNRTGVTRFIAQAAVVAGALGVWWIASMVLPVGVMPSPVESFARLGSLATTPGFWVAVGTTVATFLSALVICTVVGVPLGLAIGASGIATQSTRLVFDFLRTIPPIAILPLVLLTIGANFQMVLTLVVLGAIWPILIQSVYAARQGEPLLAEMATSYQVPRAWYIRHIFFPGALPFIMTGLRIGTTICLLLTITGELLGGAPGVGFEIADAQAYYDNSRMNAYVLVSAALGLIVNALFYALQRRLLRWHASERREVTS